MSKQYIMKNGTAVEVTVEVYEILKKSDRRIKYVEHDLKEQMGTVDKPSLISRLLFKKMI